MPTTMKSTILKRIERLSERDADPIKLAVPLAQLEAETSSPRRAHCLIVKREQALA